MATAVGSLNAQEYGESSMNDLERCQVVARSYCPGIKEVARTDRGRVYFKLKNGKKLMCTDYDRYDLAIKDDYLKQLANVDASDIVEQAYPFTATFISPLGIEVVGSEIELPIPEENYSPGRIRNDELSKSTYGFTKKGVQANLRVVKFLGKKVMFNKQNGAADALERIGHELNRRGLSKKLLSVRAYAGTFVHRKISGTNRLSSHSFGTAIDLTPKDKKLATYWKWSARCRKDIKKCNKKLEKDLEIVPPRNFDHFKIPGEDMLYEVVSIFEENGFIWGGKWHHFDTMHFEYRPEFMGGNDQCERLTDSL
jgi:hypothetical protein